MPLGRCEWCDGYHDIRPDRCKEIERKTHELESTNPRLREARLKRQIDELKRGPRMRF